MALFLFLLPSNLITIYNKSHRLLQLELICANIQLCRNLKEHSDDQHERRFHYSRRGSPYPQDVRGNRQAASTKKAIARIQNWRAVADSEGRTGRLLSKAEKPREIKKAGRCQQSNTKAVR